MHGGGREQAQESKEPGLWCDSHPSPCGYPFSFHHLALSLEFDCPHCKKSQSIHRYMCFSFPMCCQHFFVVYPFLSPRLFALKYTSLIAKTCFCYWTKLHSSHNLSINTTQIIQEVGHIFFLQNLDMSEEQIKKSLHDDMIFMHALFNLPVKSCETITHSIPRRHFCCITISIVA
jgi:hypothetical protein